MVISIYSSPTESLAVLCLYKVSASRTVRRDRFRALGLLLLPCTSILQVLGQSTDLRAWLAGITGSTEVILTSSCFPTGQFRNRTLSEVYGILLSRIIRILRHRLAREVSTSAVTNMENRDYLPRCKYTLLPGRPLVTSNSLITF
jgi:hypothetical protein